MTLAWTFLAYVALIYSAVIHPRPAPLSQRGTPSSMDAVQSTFVRPIEIMAEPCACSR